MVNPICNDIVVINQLLELYRDNVICMQCICWQPSQQDGVIKPKHWLLLNIIVQLCFNPIYLSHSKVFYLIACLIINQMSYNQIKKKFLSNYYTPKIFYFNCLQGYVGAHALFMCMALIETNYLPDLSNMYP